MFFKKHENGRRKRLDSKNHILHMLLRKGSMWLKTVVVCGVKTGSMWLNLAVLRSPLVSRYNSM